MFIFIESRISVYCCICPVYILYLKQFFLPSISSGVIVFSKFIYLSSFSFCVLTYYLIAGILFLSVVDHTRVDLMTSPS